MTGFIVQAIELYSYIVLASVLVSWIQLPRDNPLVQLLDTFTEPLLAPIRKIIPDMGGLDFSPMILYVLLNILSAQF
jgi:YggT family protein